MRKQLAIDIEAGGGIQEFDSANRFALDGILNDPERDDIYQGRDDPRWCKQVRNLVFTQWKKFSREKYLTRVIIPFGIQPPKKSKPPPPKPDISPPSSPKSGIASSSFSEEETVAKPVPRARATPPTTAKVNTRYDRSMTTDNCLGKQLLLTLPKGLIFCVIWVDSKLSNLNPFITGDGMEVKVRSRKPCPANAAALIPHYDWATDDTNYVVAALDEELTRLKPDDDAPPENNDLARVRLPEEVIKSFVNHKGVPVTESQLQHYTNPAGQQIITFFLKTVAAHQSQQNHSRGFFAHNQQPIGMGIPSAYPATQHGRSARTAAHSRKPAPGVSDQEDESMTGSVLDDVAEEVESQVNDMKKDIENQLNQYCSKMDNQMGSLMEAVSKMTAQMSHQQQFQQYQYQQQFEAEQQMQMQKEQNRQAFEQQQNQQVLQQQFENPGAQPDGAMSS